MQRTSRIGAAILALLTVAASGRSCNPCRENQDCAEAEYCAKLPGTCEGVGVCKNRPDQCVEVSAAVCGCDGRTYDSACAAAEHGVNVAQDGGCEPSHCSSNQQCDKLQYCFFADCTLETGVCRDRPSACEGEEQPVCGCDGRTYPDNCQAASEGVSIAHSGECGDPADLCASTRGVVTTVSCCLTAEDFPETCRVGPCGCSPENSHQVLACKCPRDQCFNRAVGCH